MSTPQRILGIDPGSRITGYGVIELHGRAVKYVDSGCIRLGSGDMPKRLATIHQGISELIRLYQPQLLAIEAVFVAKNPASALKLVQARGVAICTAALSGLSIAEYAPRSIKQAITGKGSAEKIQIQHMVKILLNQTGKIQSDAADALAVALTHAHHLRSQEIR